jgi:DnaJ-class molecular chaperone
MNENEDYYKILGVDRKATKEEIKRAYRKKSLVKHPDRSKDNNATEEFQKITEAYDILGDANKRSTYDQRFGYGFIDNLHKNQGFPSDMFDFIRENLNGVGAFDFATEINNGNMKFFHVDGNSHVNYQEVMQRPRPIVKKVMISLQQAFTGCTLPLEIERWVYDGSVKKTEIETVYFSIPEGVDDNEIIIIREKGNVISVNSKGDIKIFITLTNDT